MKLNLPDKDRLSLREVATAVEKHTATIWRWALRGVRGHRLESYVIGGQRYVDRRALESFLGALNDMTIGPLHVDCSHPDRTDSQLDSHGF